MKNATNFSRLAYDDGCKAHRSLILWLILITYSVIKLQVFTAKSTPKPIVKRFQNPHRTEPKRTEDTTFFVV